VNLHRAPKALTRAIIALFEGIGRRVFRSFVQRGLPRTERVLSSHGAWAHLLG
jgi:hypothetical protein